MSWVLVGSSMHYNVYYDSALGQRLGRDRAGHVLDHIEDDWAWVDGHFNFPWPRSGRRASVYIKRPDSNDPVGTWDQDTYNIHIFPDDADSYSVIRGVFVHELSEQYMYADVNGWGYTFRHNGNEGSDGEALALTFQSEFGYHINSTGIRDQLYTYNLAGNWLDNHREDWVNHTRNYFLSKWDWWVPVGCGVVFLDWMLHIKGHSLKTVANNGASTLAGMYHKVTGSGIDPFKPFRQAVDAKFPTNKKADPVIARYHNSFRVLSSAPQSIAVPHASRPADSVAPGAPPAATVTYTFAGASEHFRIYYSNAFNQDGFIRSTALQWLTVVEDDLAMLARWFGDASYLSGTVNLYLDVDDAAGPHAYWIPAKQFETHIMIRSTGGMDSSLGMIRYQWACEVSEQFMKLQNRGWFHPDSGLEGTNGEALSITVGRELAKLIGAETTAAPWRFIDQAWLNGSRADWVNSSLSAYDGNSLDRVGCDILFIYYLMYERGFSLSAVIDAAATTLRGVYRNLTNDPTDPFPTFRALVDSGYPVGTKVTDRNREIFPISPVPIRYPGNESVVVPDATIAGYVDGLTVSGGSSSFTTSTELTQFAGGDVTIPPVTSGSPLAAVDLAWQLAGNNRVTYFIPSDLTGTYWSLQGHEAGFDFKTQKIVSGRDESVYRLFHEKIDPVTKQPVGAVYRCWRVKDSYSSTGWAAYGDAIYSTGGQGSSVSVAPQTRTHIVATARPGGAAVTFSFGTGFSDLGFGPNGEKEGFGKYFTVSVSTAELSISGGYRKANNVGPVANVSSRVSTLPLNLDATSSVQVLISLEWSDAQTFTILATAATDDFQTVSATLPMTGTGIDPFAAPWKHSGPIRGLFVQTVKKSDDPISNLIGPYQSPVPMRTTVTSWGLGGSPILGMTGTLWDYLTQVAVARQVDIRNDNGTLVVTSLLDVAYMSHLWSPVASPSIAYGLDNAAKTIEITRNLATWKTTGTTFYDSRKATDSFTVPQGATTKFTVTTAAAANLYYTPAPVGGVSSITTTMLDNYTAGLKLADTDPNRPGLVQPAISASINDGLRDVAEWRDEKAHAWGAYIVSGTFAGISNHTMPAPEWIAYGGAVQVAASSDGTSITITVTAPAIPGWEGDYVIGISDSSTTFPMLRLVGTGVSYKQSTIRYNTGADPRSTTTATGTTVTNVAATSMAAVNTLAARAVHEASGPSMQLTAAISMAEVRRWGITLGQIPGSTLLYKNMQWRILSATISNASVSVTATPFTTYQSAYWLYNWDGLTVDQFIDYWGDSRWDDYKVAPLSGAIADWTNTGGIVKHTLFPTPDPNDPNVPLEPSDTLLPGRFIIPYAGPGAFGSTIFPGAVFPSGEVAVNGA